MLFCSVRCAKMHCSGTAVVLKQRAVQVAVVELLGCAALTADTTLACVSKIWQQKVQCTTVTVTGTPFTHTADMQVHSAMNSSSLTELCAVACLNVQIDKGTHCVTDYRY